ncbi:MAG: chemotaxis response regulator protein-glutamate methylesterase [Gammaproteobacteria bacterium]|nr:chemotaxis response regulator protein-glutamate methylesterase [Gammaproteobacteria bacterium]
MTRPIKVLIVDDSALVRRLLTEIINSDPGMEVVGVAPDPYIAREKIKLLSPDVLTLDVEMPKMDGVTFLKNLMRLRPMPVVMVSSLTVKGADVTLKALEIGAVDYVSKPTTDIAGTLGNYRDELIDKLRAAANAQVKPYQPLKKIEPVEQKFNSDAVIERRIPTHFVKTKPIIALGASTGGTEAIKEVLMRLPACTPGMVITQHIPGNFSAAFADRVNSLSAMSVCEAVDGQQVLPGHAYIAPGSQHLLLVRNGADYFCQLNDGPPVNRHKPSVDVLFRSVAQTAGPNALGVILTGMGSDGAEGMKEMQEAGAPTIAQDEKTSVVWGMPGSAVKLGAADDVLPLESIADRILALIATKQVGTARNLTTCGKSYGT